MPSGVHNRARQRAVVLELFPEIDFRYSRAMTKPVPFRSLQTGEETVSLLIDGKPVDAPAGVSVAALLIREGRGNRIHAKGGERAPYCMMGVCFECLVTINGVRNRQGCLVTVAEGMDIGVQDHV